ncbi:hypothetical protein ACLOJK_021020 [Asimina triloba]
MTYGRDRGIILRASAEDRDCVLANTLAASFLSSSDHSAASSYLASAKSRLDHATPYEKAVFDTVQALMADDRDNDVVLDLHAKLLKEFPRDLVSLKAAQMLCFYMGRPQPSLQLVEQVLPQNQEQSFIYGMLAFPLLELGRMAEAKQAARKGFDIDKQDVWSQHNKQRHRYTHNWWHVALCYLEGHSPISKVLEVYDQRIWKETQRTDADPAEVYLNALGLFLRLDVRGVVHSSGDRLKTVASCVTHPSTWHKEWLLDLLALWALAACNETSKAEDLLQGMKSRISAMSKKKQHLMKRGILEKAYSMAGMASATVAAEKAKTLESAYFEQMG